MLLFVLAVIVKFISSVEWSVLRIMLNYVNFRQTEAADLLGRDEAFRKSQDLPFDFEILILILQIPDMIAESCCCSLFRFSKITIVGIPPSFKICCSGATIGFNRGIRERSIIFITGGDFTNSYNYKYKYLEVILSRYGAWKLNIQIQDKYLLWKYHEQVPFKTFFVLEIWRGWSRENFD